MDAKHHTKIVEWLQNANAIVINAGAGMGVDSGLADYRGSGGQWGSVESETGESVFEIMNPKNFNIKPDYLWQLMLKRTKDFYSTAPHEGFYILKKWIEKFNLDYFVITSNIDGHFQKAGYSNKHIRELHGAISYYQCTKPCTRDVWEYMPDIDKLEKNISLKEYPTCPKCGAMSRPNIYMFRDNTFVEERSKTQEANFQNFLKRNKGKSVVVFEIGSGPHVQSIRKKTRMLIKEYNARVVRINPKYYDIKEPHIGIAKGALETLSEIDELIDLG